MPPASMKASVTSLAATTSRNGPNGTGAGRPKSSTKRSAATRLSFEWTMVWFSLMAMDVDTTTHADEESVTKGRFVAGPGRDTPRREPRRACSPRHRRLVGSVLVEREGDVDDLVVEEIGQRRVAAL